MTEALPFEWAVRQCAYPGQIDSGDRHVFQPFGQGVLISVIDGLGHGDKAAEAAQAAVESLLPYPHDEPILLIQRCHQQLARTRGAVMSIASLDMKRHILTWIGVGNVTGVLVRQRVAEKREREYLHLRGGIVGYRLPPLRQFELPFESGDTLIFVTDGIRSEFLDEATLGRSPNEIAENILEAHSRGTDDALVLVARYTGTNSLT